MSQNLINKIQNLKPIVKNFFNVSIELQVSLSYLMNVMRDFYIISIGINEINYGIKNPKRFKISIMHQSRNSN